MKKTHLLRFALLTLPLFAAAPTHAGVNAAIVPADARWLIYADLNALRQSTVGKELLPLAEKAQITTPAGTIGMDWQKLLATVGTVTAYGTNLSPDPKDIDGTLLVQGSPDLRKIAESLLIQANLANPKDVTELTDLPFPAYSLKDSKAKAAKETKPAAVAAAEVKEAKPKKSAEPVEIIIAFPPEPVVIVSKAKPQILKAYDVFRGRAASLAKADKSPLAKFLHGADNVYLFGASAVPTDKFFKDDGPQARILQMASAGSTTVGERGPDLFLHAELVASSSQAADKTMKILQGLTAMMSLAETNDKALTDFINSATVNRTGDVVTLDLSYASARLAQMVKGLQQQAKPAGRQELAIVSGTAVAQWTADAVPVPADGTPPTPVVLSRTIENIALKNGTTITLGKSNVRSGNARFERVEITPAGGGAALVFNAAMLRTGGPRGNWQYFAFPGADGAYTLKVTYKNDSSGESTYAVSIRDPRPEPAPAPVPKPPAPPASESK